ncbi:MAG: DUF433 domain-containing protein [Verrucomicrobiaceae bacterium]|nr:MAG: DUF433 domain-containing protein [Verrucomicrobiaceae bacterium]
MIRTSSDAQPAGKESETGLSKGRGIQKTPGVCGGSARVVGTRIPVCTLESLRRLDVEEARILDSYPSLTASDLADAWVYANACPVEIDREIRENEED